jgi:ribonuclease HII
MIKEELYQFDDEQRERFGIICGVDEAGRGPLAGPVCCAAVILPSDIRFEWLDDSKKVTPKRREKLFDEIKTNALAFHIELVDNDTIDSINILQATMLGMKKCIEALQCDQALIDGNSVPNSNVPCTSIIKGDSKSASIAAASVLAKVTRDRYMDRLAEEYPQYGFDKNKGYPTKSHYEAIRTYGPTKFHRKTFLRKIH